MICNRHKKIRSILVALEKRREKEGGREEIWGVYCRPHIYSQPLTSQNMPHLISVEEFLPKDTSMSY